jgi:hypothetical protein
MYFVSQNVPHNCITNLAHIIIFQHMTYIISFLFFPPHAWIQKDKKSPIILILKICSKSYYMWKMTWSTRSICTNDYCIRQYLSTPSHCSIKKIHDQKAHGIIFNCENECLSHHASTFHSKHIMIIWQPHVHELKVFHLCHNKHGYLHKFVVIKSITSHLDLEPIRCSFSIRSTLYYQPMYCTMDLVTINVLPTLHTFETWKKKSSNSD